MAPASKAEGRVLLPDAVTPSRYDVRLVPDLVKFTFDGSQKITVDVNEATDEISLHLKEVYIKHDKVTFRPSDGEAPSLESVQYNVEKETVTFKFSGMLPVGTGTLAMEFIGILNDQMAGFYRSSYKDITGKSKIMASTQFESLDARRAFPCWDEPARKAVFAVTLVVDADLTAFSNMPEKSSKLIEAGKKLELTFMDSPKMSTYLLAFVVGEFDFVQSQSKNGVLVRVYTPPGRAKDGEFPLKVATQTLDGYDEYFGIPFPLPKLDMVAIPEFAAGAMENWGLVTYREVDLLIAEGASRNQLQRVTIVVTHELAHQWFGNLVTMQWWDDLWLNEGFASWCENYLADVLFPEYGMWDQFVSDTQAAALRLDALRSSHPIQVPIREAKEVEEVFDAISYCKGASVIKMAHAYLGAKSFQQGLRDYFAKHKYSNTETDDLWQAWGDASGKPVKDVMASWTEQMGFPVVRVKSCSGVTVELEQSWFLADGSEVKPEEEKTWKIPLIYSVDGGKPSDPVLMEEKTYKLTLPASGAVILLNAGREVPMRVMYTEQMYKDLASAIEKGQLSVPDRAGLVLDVFAFAKAGLLGADAVIRLLSSFKNEKNFVVWDAISMSLAGLDNVFMAGCSEAIYAQFLAFVTKLTSNVMAQVGWEAQAADGHLDGLLRETVIQMQARFSKDEATISEARRRFAAFLAGDNTQVPDDIKEPVFKIVLKNGGSQVYEQIQELYKKAETLIEKKHIYTTIGQTDEMPLKKRVLEWAVSGDIPIQDFFYPVGSVARSGKDALKMTWEFYKANFDKIKGMTEKANPSIMDAMISFSAGGFCTKEAADEVEAFLKSKEKDLKGNQRTITQILEGIRTNATFLDRVLKTPVVDEAFWRGLQ